MATVRTSLAQRATAVLAIRHKTSRLLQLPREIRDLIYYFVLVEPCKWDKEHVPQCPFHDYDASSVAPPYVIESLKGVSRVPENNVRERTCVDRCIRRKNLSLMRTNRQIHEEADEMFWKENPICFDTDHRFRCDAATLDPKDSVACQKIQKLSILEHRQVMTQWEPRYVGEQDLRNCVAGLPALRHLEIPADGVRSGYVWPFALLDRVHVRVVQRSVTQVTFHNHRFPIWLTIVKKLPPLRCSALSESSDRMAHVETGCENCTQRINDFRATLMHWVAASEFDEPSWQTTVKRKLETLEPGRVGGYTVGVKMPDGTSLSVQVRGLPYESPRAQRKRLHKAKLAPKAAVTRRPHAGELNDDEEDSVGPSSRTIYHYRGRNRNLRNVREQEDERRSQVRNLQKQHEVARQRSQMQKAVKQRSDAEREVAEAKRSARKRFASS